MRLARMIVATLALTLALAGSGGGSDAPQTASAPATERTAATSVTTPSETTPATTASATITVAPGPDGDPRLPDHNFRLPSGNIGCVAFASPDFNVVTCEARHHAWSLPPKPAGCDFEWVAYLEVRATGDGALGICTSNPLVGDVHTPGLPFIGVMVPGGSSIRAGAILCRSENRGLTCTNPEGHGFFLSRERARAF